MLRRLLPRLRSERLSRAVNTADLMAVWVKEIAQIHGAHRTLAYSRRIFRGGAAIGDSRIVEFLQVFWRVADEADGSAVGNGRGFAINWLGNAKC